MILWTAVQSAMRQPIKDWMIVQSIMRKFIKSWTAVQDSLSFIIMSWMTVQSVMNSLIEGDLQKMATIDTLASIYISYGGIAAKELK